MSLLAQDYLRTVVYRLIDNAEYRVVLSVYFDYADNHGRRMFPGADTVAHLCVREPTFVQQVVDDCIELRLLCWYTMDNGRRALRTIDDLSLWVRCGKPVEGLFQNRDLLPFADPLDPSDPPREIHQAGARAGPLPLEVEHDQRAERLAAVRAGERCLRADTAAVRARARPQWPARHAK
jgi:hypothetical protein